MNQLKKLIDRVIFLVVSVALVILFVFWKGCDMKGPGPGGGQPIGKPGTTGMSTDMDSSEQKSNVAELHEQKSSVSNTDTEPTPIAKLFLGGKGKGISEDRVNWHDIGEFADFIKQLQDRGVKEVHYTLLPDSIERYEERWAEELKKANMRSYINTD